MTTATATETKAQVLAAALPWLKQLHARSSSSNTAATP